MDNLYEKGKTYEHSLSVSGKLGEISGQPAGEYSGTITVTVTVS